jgi:hypothetical protein
MSDPAARLLLVVVAVVVALGVAGILRRRAIAPKRVLRNTRLAPGTYFFTASACIDCGPVRSLLDNRLGPDGYVEYTWEADQKTLESLKIDVVPATLVVNEDGSGTLWAGAPDAMFSAVDP